MSANIDKQFLGLLMEKVDQGWRQQPTWRGKKPLLFKTSLILSTVSVMLRTGFLTNFHFNSLQLTSTLGVES